jgi:hypothetical protein
MLCRRCRLGPLACRCFRAVSVSVPSADALPRRWSLCLGGVLLPVFRPPLMLLRACRPHPRMLCRVDGLRAWAEAFLPGVSSGCFAAVIFYGSSSLLATVKLSYFVLGSVSWGCQVEGSPPPHVSCFSFLLWTSVVILGLLANPLVSTMCRSIDHSCQLNEKQAICLISKKIISGVAARSC